MYLPISRAYSVMCALVQILKYRKSLISLTHMSSNGQDPSTPLFVYLNGCLCLFAVFFYFLNSFWKILTGVRYLDYHDGPFTL